MKVIKSVILILLLSSCAASKINYTMNTGFSGQRALESFRLGRVGNNNNSSNYKASAIWKTTSPYIHNSKRGYATKTESCGCGYLQSFQEQNILRSRLQDQWLCRDLLTLALRFGCCLPYGLLHFYPALLLPLDAPLCMTPAESCRRGMQINWPVALHEENQVLQ